MKFISALAVFLTCSGAAVGQTTQCQSIPKASDRLACYDKAAPPIAALKPPSPAGKAAAAQTSIGQGQVVDRLAVENSKLDARLKTICRGC